MDSSCLVVLLTVHLIAAEDRLVYQKLSWLLLVCLVAHGQSTVHSLSCLLELRSVIARHGRPSQEVVAARSARIGLCLGLRASTLVHDDDLLCVFVGLSLTLGLFCLQGRTLVRLNSRSDRVWISGRERRRMATGGNLLPLSAVRLMLLRLSLGLLSVRRQALVVVVLGCGNVAI